MDPEAALHRAYTVAFERFQVRLAQELDPEKRLLIASMIRDLASIVAKLDRDAARGVVFIASSFEHGVRSDDPVIPDEAPVFVDGRAMPRFGRAKSK